MVSSLSNINIEHDYIWDWTQSDLVSGVTNTRVETPSEKQFTSRVAEWCGS